MNFRKLKYLYLFKILIASCILPNPVIAKLDNFVKHKIKVDGEGYDYYTYEPKSLSADKSYPLMILIHGALSDADFIERYTQMSKLADKQQFVILYPEKSSLFNWNKELNSENRDLKYLSELLNRVKKQEISTKKLNLDEIYLVGYSAGGLIAQALNCRYPDTFKALAIMGSTINRDYIANCGDVSNPILFFLGTEDSYFKFQKPVAEHLSMDKTLEFWSDQNHKVNKTNLDTLKNNPRKSTYRFPNKNHQDQSTAELITYTKAPATQLIKVFNGGHTWPGKKPLYFYSSWFLGNTNYDISANDLIWEFFQAESIKR
jgi:polyhydroxybutyrate depolymerase